nr:DMT family transporter [Pusillimonas sp. ANT_WB101]
MTLVTMSWGLNFSVVKILTSVLSELWIVMLRMMLATVTLALCMVWQRVDFSRFETRRWFAMLACGFFTVYLNQQFFIKGLHLTTAGNATLMIALNPALAAVAAAIAFRDKVSWSAMVGLLIGFGGVAFVIAGRSGAEISTVGMGEFFIFVAMSAFICGGLIMQRLAQSEDAFQITLIVQVMGSALLALHVAVFEGWSNFPLAQIDFKIGMLLLYSGAIGTALSNLAWFYSVAKVGQRRAAVFFYCVPVFGLLFSVLLLGEVIRWQHGVGLALVIAGTRLGVMVKRSVKAVKPGTNPGGDEASIITSGSCPPR